MNYVSHFEEIRIRMAGLPCPYRFLNVPSEKAKQCLIRDYQPPYFGWLDENIQLLGLRIRRFIPEDLAVYLRVMGSYHGILCGRDARNYSPNAFAGIADKVADYGEEVWALPGDHEFYSHLKCAIFLDALGGFWFCYLVPQPIGPSKVYAWHEGLPGEAAEVEFLGFFPHVIERWAKGKEERNRAQMEEGRLVECVEPPYLRMGGGAGLNLLDLPHRHYHLLQDPRAGNPTK